jgi:hypothetical protein
MRLVLTLGVAALSAVPAPALAQNRTVSARGSGSLSVPNAGAIPLYEADFKQSGRTLTLVFVGKNAALPFTLEGRITGNTSGSDLPIEITGGLRDAETRGSGRVVLSGGGLATVDLKGTGKEGPFTLEFRGEGGSVGGGAGGNWDAGGTTGARPINQSTTGSGSYELSGRRSNLNEMRIRLRDDGRAELRFDGDRGDLEGNGTWRRGSNGRAEISLIEWDGRRTSGTATVTYRGREIERVGVSVPARNVRIEFYPGRSGDDDWDENNNNARPVNTSFVGTGTFRERGRTYQLEEVSIRLRSNGEAELRFDGERQTRGRGRWTPNGSYAALTIQEWDGRSTQGTGNVAFTGNRPQQVSVTLQGGRSIAFRARPQMQPR